MTIPMQAPVAGNRRSREKVVFGTRALPVFASTEDWLQNKYLKNP